MIRWSGAETTLNAEERRAFRLHRWHSIFEAFAAGILANAGLMAVKELHASDSQLTLPLGISSLGMFASWAVSQRMARRNKRPYILVPFALQVACALAMALVSNGAWFLVFAGVAAVFETMVRPAMAAFLRQNYRPEVRGGASGNIRGWCALAFLASNLGSAALMQQGGGGRSAIAMQMGAAAVLLAACLACISGVRIQEAEGKREPSHRAPDERVSSWSIVARDRRFRIYLIGTSLFLVGGLMYVSLIPAVLSKNFGYGYVAVALLQHVVPSVVSFFSTLWVGARLDRAHPLRLWAWLRVGWGLDPLVLALSALLAPFAPVGLVLVTLARVCRGCAMGTTWVLWWMVGVNYFAVPGADTSRYMGIQVLLNGSARLGAAAISTWLLVGMDRISVLLIGGAMVMISALHVGWQSHHDPEGSGSLLAQDRKFQGEE